jgi:class 3 adenylate cyclase
LKQLINAPRGNKEKEDMAWNKETSTERINTHLDSIEEIEIKELTREMVLDTLSETRCREIFGAYVYANVNNFSRLLSSGAYAKEDYKRMIQGLHIYQREVSRIVEDVFDGERIHFQGPKLHALFYQPIGNGESLATKAVLLGLTLRDFVNNVFNPAFPIYGNFSLSVGTDIGTAVGTKNGSQGDRELLFLGAPANHAAKIIPTTPCIRITSAVFNELPNNLQDLCEDVGDNVYKVSSTQTELDKVLDFYDIAWDRTKSKDRIDDDKDKFPLKDIDYSSANTLIDIDSLSIKNNKRITAVSVFADVSGFTRYIDDATTEEDKKAALRVFHAIRKEMATVIKKDYQGVRVQYQGDRVQGIFHLPENNRKDICEEAIGAAVGLQSSLELCIKEILPKAKALKLAVGVDIGTTLVSKLGSRGQRDRICIGDAVESAACFEDRTNGGDIGISGNIRTELPEYLQEVFSYNPNVRGYVASGLTADKVEALRKAKRYEDGAPVYIRSDSDGTRVSDSRIVGGREITPKKPWAEL